MEATHVKRTNPAGGGKGKSQHNYNGRLEQRRRSTKKGKLVGHHGLEETGSGKVLVDFRT